jgi:hypothetical protein
MNVDFKIALLALAGVLIGAVITSGVTYVMEREKRQREVRRAARMIDADLLFAVSAARMSIEHKKWWPATELRLTTEGWQEYRFVVASELSQEDWARVMVAVLAVVQLQSRRDNAHTLDRAQLATDPATADVLASAEALGLDITDAHPTISDTAVEVLRPVLADLEAGRAALASLTAD